MADVEVSIAGGLREVLKDMGDGTHARTVTIIGLDTPVEITGTANVDVWGATDDALEADPNAADATINSLERGQLAAQTAIKTAVEALADTIGSASTSDVLQTVILRPNNGNAVDPATYDQMAELIQLIGSAGDSPGANTVIGQLKQIAANTAP